MSYEGKTGKEKKPIKGTWFHSPGFFREEISDTEVRYVLRMKFIGQKHKNYLRDEEGYYTRNKIHIKDGKIINMSSESPIMVRCLARYAHDEDDITWEQLQFIRKIFKS